MKFEPKHVVAMVASVCAAAVLAPVGVIAATGTLVNITDPSVASRKARVTTSGSLQTESRAGFGPNTINRHWTADTLESFTFSEVTGPDRLALTELTLGSVGPSNGTTTGHHYVDIVSYVQGTGTGTCGTSSTGWTVTTLRRTVVRNFHPSVQIDWSGPVLLAPKPANGKKACVIVRVNTFTTGSVVYISATGYRVTG
ncbi:MAG TPA: hypothetical protein VNA20_11175 [Frankiaceae bacterium]|nr:hypothetical protein [Frankiaceae bacterium]